MATTDGSDGGIADSGGSENVDGEHPGLIARYRTWRAELESKPASRRIFRLVVGIIGTIVLCLGILAIPYPGPGWLVVFTGLGILASEFAWAQSVLHWVRGKYDIVMDWYLRQNLLVRGLGALLTCAVVVATLWLLGAFGLMASWFGLDLPWLDSPIPFL